MNNEPNTESIFKNNIATGDIVTVNFNGSQSTLCKRAEVLHIPAATGDSWHFRDLDTNQLHYVSEGCTITYPFN